MATDLFDGNMAEEAIASAIILFFHVKNYTERVFASKKPFL